MYRPLRDKCCAVLSCKPNWYTCRSFLQVFYKYKFYKHLHFRWDKKKKILVVLSVIFVIPTTKTYSYFLYRFAFLNLFITFMAAVLGLVMPTPHQRVPPVTQRAPKSVILIPQGVKSTSTSIMSTECFSRLCLVRLSNI